MIVNKLENGLTTKFTTEKLFFVVVAVADKTV